MSGEDTTENGPLHFSDSTNAIKKAYQQSLTALPQDPANSHPKSGTWRRNRTLEVAAELNLPLGTVEVTGTISTEKLQNILEKEC